ncbi:hypothetical protein WMY93_014228 [Mugilogobius chulae]|uniref:Uncharacterized protein n=1 Tax=Mugilogobius chulae TaxID=88201 RepID=A0AAW0NWD1_9GOBI
MNDRAVCIKDREESTRAGLSSNLESVGMSSDQCDSILLSVDSLLHDAGQMQRQCRERTEQLSRKAAQLQRESAGLREQSERAQHDMVRIRRQLDELIQTKAAFEARERQAQKLSKQL